MITVSRSRCAVVASGLTAAAWGAAAVLVRWLGTASARTADAAVAQLCLAAVLVAVALAWLQGMAAVAEAWGGASGRGHRGVVRRVVLAACGIALTGALTAPAHADTDPLNGLPLPDRPVGRVHPPRGQTAVVHAGDTLWALAEAGLPSKAGPGVVAARSLRIHRLNRGVIGPDPDLILPGQVLRLPTPQRTRQ